MIPILPTLENLLDQFENIGGLEMTGPEGLTLLLALWRKSMKLSWAKSFLMTNTELIYKSGLKNRESLNNYRNKLVQIGLIEYKAPPRGKSDGTYTLEFDLIAAVQGKVVKEVVRIPDNLADSFPDNSTYNLPYNPADSFPDTIEGRMEGQKDGGKEHAHAHNENPFSTFIREFEMTFRTTVNRPQREMLNTFLDDGMDLEVVIFGVKEAQRNNAHHENYLWRTLTNWLDCGVRTVLDYRKFMQERAEMNAAAQQQAATREGTGGKRFGKHQANDSGHSTGAKVVSITGGQVGWVRPEV